MSTIEGGMICTNDKNIYELARVLRSHGMARELHDKKVEKNIINKNKDLSPKFIFLHPSYNVRNNEIGAVLGISQLKRLNRNNIQRSKNFSLFLKLIDHKKYFFRFFDKRKFQLRIPNNFENPRFKKKEISLKIF